MIVVEHGYCPNCSELVMRLSDFKRDLKALAGAGLSPVLTGQEEEDSYVGWIADPRNPLLSPEDIRVYRNFDGGPALVAGDLNHYAYPTMRTIEEVLKSPAGWEPFDGGHADAYEEWKGDYPTDDMVQEYIDTMDIRNYLVDRGLSWSEADKVMAKLCERYASSLWVKYLRRLMYEKPEEFDALVAAVRV